MNRLLHLPLRLSVCSFLTKHALCEEAKIEGNIVEDEIAEMIEKEPEPIASNIFIEPYTYTHFKPEIEVKRVKIRKKQQKILTNNLQFVGAGLRCMLGESALCHIASTRVYTFGLYVNKGAQRGEQGAGYEEAILSQCPGIVKTVRIYSNVTKTGRHWALGYKQTIRKRINRFGFNRQERDQIRADTKKFVKVFKQQGTIPAGTEILLTWADNKLVVEIDGDVKCVIRNNNFALLIFRAYLARDSVNHKVSQFIRTNWYTPFDVEGDEKQQWLRSLNKEQQQIHSVKCVLKGNNYDTYCTSNITMQNRSYLDGHVPVDWDDDDFDDDEDVDEGMYYVPK